MTYSRVIARAGDAASRVASGRPSIIGLSRALTAGSSSSSSITSSSRDSSRRSISSRGYAASTSFPPAAEGPFVFRRHPQAFFGRGQFVSSPFDFDGPRFLSTESGVSDGDSSGEKRGEEASSGNSDDEDDDDDEIALLGEELAKTQGQLKDTRDKALYLAAEMENVRSIAKRDAESARLYAVQKFAKQLLEVADNLERALSSAEGIEDKLEVSTPNSLFFEGVRMTSLELHKVFRSQGLEMFGEEGDKFDPHLHDAMFEFPDSDREPGTLGQVLKSGYKLHGRVIRAAQVGTVKAP